MAEEITNGGGILASKISQGGVLGSLVALVALNGLSAVQPTEPDVTAPIKENQRLIRDIQKEQSDLHYSIKSLNTSVDRLSVAIEKLNR